MQLSPSPRPGIPRFNETPPRLPPPLPSPCGFNVPLGRQSSGRYRPLIQQQPCLACSMNKQAVVPSSPADLQKHGMQAVVSLSTQYRMAEDIQLLANTLMYSSALRPGNAAVASAMLHLPHYPVPDLPPWLVQVRQSFHPGRHVTFLHHHVICSPRAAQQGLLPNFEPRLIICEAT